jgi:hypothetical protein
MNRGVLAVAAVAVLVAVIGLLVLLRTDGGDPERTRQSPADSSGVQKIAETASGKPRIPSAARPEVTEYRVGDVRVRDHRTGEHGPVPIARRPLPRPDGREIPSRLTSDLGQRVRSVVWQCVAAVPADARGAGARAEGQILVSIKDHQATVTAATLQLRNVAETAQPEFDQCLARSAVGLVASAGNESDLDDYSITLSLTLP